MPVTCNLKGDKEKKGRWSRGVPVKTGPEIEVRQSVKPRPPEDGRWKIEARILLESISKELRLADTLISDFCHAEL